MAKNKNSVRRGKHCYLHMRDGKEYSVWDEKRHESSTHVAGDEVSEDITNGPVGETPVVIPQLSEDDPDYGDQIVELAYKWVASQQASKSAPGVATTMAQVKRMNSQDSQPAAESDGSKITNGQAIPIVPLVKPKKANDTEPEKENFFKRHWKKILGIGATALLGMSIFFGASSCNNKTISQPETIEQTDKQPDQAGAQKNQKTEAAEALGVSVDQYELINTEAQATGLTAEEVKDFADHYDVSYENLGTPEAQAQLRDQVSGKYNVNEVLLADGNAEVAKREFLFLAHNSPAMLAQFISVIDTTDPAGLDGLEEGTAIINERLSVYGTDGEAMINDFARVQDYIENSTVAVREATDKITYSTADFGKDGKVLTVVRHAENLGGNKWIYYINGTGDYHGIDAEFKTMCGQLNVPGAAKGGYRGKHFAPNPSSPNAPGRPDQPVNPGEPVVEPKDPTDNDDQQNGATNFEDDAPASDEETTYEGEVDPDAQVNSGNTDNNVSNGSEKVPDTDASGDIPGQQPQEPDWNNW